MKLSYSRIIVVLAILGALVVAGCTSSSPGTSPTAATLPAQVSATVSTATVAPSSGNLTTLGSAIDYSIIHWYDYQTTGSSAGAPTTGDMREDFGVTYNGASVNKVAMTTTITVAGTQTSTVITTYSDPSSGSTLGGHMTITGGGQVIMDQDVPADQASSAYNASAQNLLVTNSNARLTSVGSESVTVPAGTYTATEYTWTNAEGTGNVWIASDLPVPVKITGNAQGTTMEMDLVGWG